MAGESASQQVSEKTSGSLGLRAAFGALRALLPGFRRQAVIDADHGDALIDGTDERTEIAADAFGFIDARNPRNRREKWSLLKDRGAFLARDRSDGDAGERDCFVVTGRGVQFDMTVDGAGDAVEMDALMRAIPAGDVAEVAADALLLVNAGDDFVVEVEVFPVGDARQRETAEVVERGETLGAHPAFEAFGHVFDDAIAVVHDGGADLDGARAEEDELCRVAPGFDAADGRHG